MGRDDHPLDATAGGTAISMLFKRTRPGKEWHPLMRMKRARVGQRAARTARVRSPENRSRLGRPDQRSTVPLA